MCPRAQVQTPSTAASSLAGGSSHIWRHLLREPSVEPGLFTHGSSHLGQPFPNPADPCSSHQPPRRGSRSTCSWSHPGSPGLPSCPLQASKDCSTPGSGDLLLGLYPLPWFNTWHIRGEGMALLGDSRLLCSQVSQRTNYQPLPGPRSGTRSAALPQETGSGQGVPLPPAASGASPS